MSTSCGEAGRALSPIAISAVVKALKHRVRVGLVEHVGREGGISPSRFARLYQEKFEAGEREAVMETAYHSRALVNLGVFEIVSFAPGLRGTDHRIYGLKNPIGETTSDVTQALLGNFPFVKHDEDDVRFRLEDGAVVRVASALDHPTRLAIIRDMHGGGESWSPARWSRSREADLRHAAYHFRTLVSLSVARVVDTGENRGGREHLHDLSGPLAAAAVMTLDALEGRAEVATDGGKGGWTQRGGRR